MTANTPPPTPPPKQQNGGMDELLQIMERLRAEGGCPWDREQTLESLKQYTLEECYEVLDAVDAGDPWKHAEELGDLLLQVVFHAQIRKEQGLFTFQDVVGRVCEKLVRRHPHVFTGRAVSGTGEVLKNWEAIKAEERAENRAAAQRHEPASMMDGLAKHAPALQKAQQAQKRAARLGFDWERVEGVLDKLEEELREVRAAISSGNAETIQDEIGDILFAAVNMCRFRGINAEEALNRATAKFIRRFKAMEQRLAERGLSIGQCNARELDECWNRVKASEQAASPSSQPG